LSRLVFHPPEVKYPPNSNHIILYTESGTKIPVVFINRNAPITVVFSHGNAEDLYETEDWVRSYLLRKVHVNAVIYGNSFFCKGVEYSGYGRNTKFRPTEKSVYADIMAVYKYLTINLELNPKSIVLYGKSVGSGPSCYLAERKVIGGLILHSAFTSIFRVVFNLRFTLPFDIFPNLDRISNIHAPTLIIHGRMDEIVSFQHALDLYKNAANKVEPYFVPNGGHNDLEDYATDYFKKITDFISLIQKKY